MELTLKASLCFLCGIALLTSTCRASTDDCDDLAKRIGFWQSAQTLDEATGTLIEFLKRRQVGATQNIPQTAASETELELIRFIGVHGKREDLKFLVSIETAYRKMGVTGSIFQTLNEACQKIEARYNLTGSENLPQIAVYPFVERESIPERVWDRISLERNVPATDVVETLEALKAHAHPNMQSPAVVIWVRHVFRDPRTHRESQRDYVLHFFRKNDFRTATFLQWWFGIDLPAEVLMTMASKVRAEWERVASSPKWESLFSHHYQQVQAELALLCQYPEEGDRLWFEALGQRMRQSSSFDTLNALGFVEIIDAASGL